MKTIFLTVLTSFVFFGFNTRSPKTNFPEPPTSANRLFYIQRSNNANTVIYDANLIADKKLNLQKPIDVYWIRYAEKGQKEDLSNLQWQLAYGYKTHTANPTSNTVEITLNAFKNRPITLDYHQGKLAAFTQIKGCRASLQKVFVQLASTALIPKVAYIELFGFDSAKNQAVYERIYV